MRHRPPTSCLVHLTRNTSRSWFRSGAVQCKGFAFVRGEDRLLRDATLAAFLAPEPEQFADAVGQFEGRLRRLEGEFAVVLHDAASNRCAAAVDALRTTPLFYGRQGSRLVLSDDARFVAHETSGRPDDSVAALEYLMQGMTTGPHTLVPSVEQVLAGETILFDGSTLRHYRRAPYSTPDTIQMLDEPEERLIEMGIAALESAFQRLVQSIEGRTVIVPLSGGLDSRLVAYMLARQGVETRSFSYGNPRSFDAVTSGHVAERLEMPWQFVPYTAVKWHAWYHSASYQVYRKEASQLHTIEHEQDWPAVAQLRETGYLPEGAVVVPGHTGDVLAGSQLPEALFTPGSDLDPVTWIRNRYFRLWPQQGLSAEYLSLLDGRIREAIPGYHQPGTTFESVVLFDLYGRQERQAKLIVNSVRAYEHHGLDWRVPLWDTEVADFWLRVPPAYRRGKRLYIRMLGKLMGPLLDLPFLPPGRPKMVQRLRAILDLDYHRYGMYLGPHPLWKGLTARPGSFVLIDEPWRDGLVRCIRNLPPQRIQINGHIALHQLMDTRAEWNEDGATPPA